MSHGTTEHVQEAALRRLACQTITWGETQRDHLPTVFAEVALAGYTGVEIGFRHLSQTPPDSLRGLLEQNGLALTAVHLGGNLDDPHQADAERSILDTALDYVQSLGCHRLIYSGLRLRDESQFEQDLGRLVRAGERCRLRHTALLYHNHDWEFREQEGRIMEEILTRTPSELLGLCPDVGWVRKAEADVLLFLERAQPRIGAIHFKDFASENSGVDTVVLGDGIAPLAPVARWMQTHLPPDIWAIAEQDRSDLPPAEAVSRNARFLKGLFA